MTGRVPTVSVLFVRPLVLRLLPEPPGVLDAFYAATGLTAAMVADDDLRIAPEQLRRAWDELERLTGDPQVALAVSAQTPPGAFGIVEYLARSAPTVGEAIAIGVRYLHILDEVVQAELGPDEQTGHLALRIIVEGPIPSEACFAVVVAQARLLAGELTPVKVELTHRPVGDLGAYQRFFGAPVEFGAAQTRMLLSRQALAAPLASADPNLLAILVRHAEELLGREPAGPPVTAQVRRALCEILRAGGADIDAVATRLGLTARSLQRRLRAEGATFHAVRDELRRELASRYLASRLTIAEIAFLLGFSEASAYFRAHKRWTGETPQESRQRLAMSGGRD